MLLWVDWTNALWDRPGADAQSWSPVLGRRHVLSRAPRTLECMAQLLRSTRGDGSRCGTTRLLRTYGSILNLQHSIGTSLDLQWGKDGTNFRRIVGHKGALRAASVKGGLPSPRVARSLPSCSHGECRLARGAGRPVSFASARVTAVA